MATLKSLRTLINHKTLIVTVLAIGSTYACGAIGIKANFPLTLIGIAVVFPLVFSIGGAYKRREAALDDYGSIKGHGRAIFFAARDWMPDSDEALVGQIRALLAELLTSCRDLFQTPVRTMHDKEPRVYEVFAEISRFIQDLRRRGLASGEVSRCNQYLSKMIVAFESVKHIYQYRTPRTLKAYSQFFVYVLPVLYGPYFAGISMDTIPGIEYIMPVLFSVVLVSLENIQSHLENPFDQVGEDDIAINAEKFTANLVLQREGSPSPPLFPVHRS